MDALNALLAILPDRYLTAANTLILLGMILGRAYHAIRSGGGLVSLWNGLLYGTNTKK